MSINPLANPKNVNLLCELCQKPAFIQCTQCRVTYYCGVEHQKADWIGIHEKICSLLVPLRQPTPFSSSDEERVHQQEQKHERQKHMIDLTRTTGQRLLFEGKHDQAVPAAMQSLRFAIDVYGLASIELVPSYLILGEASIGLARLSQADEYLSQAMWTVTKTPECSNAIKSKLYRNLGLLHAANGEYNEALRHLADDIYHASLEFGTDDIRTSGGYFHMANVFFRQNQMNRAHSLYNQVVDIWYEHLYRIVKLRSKTPHTPKVVGPLAGQEFEDETLDEAQEAEAIQVLSAIFDLHETQGEGGNEPSASVAKVAHALAMLYYVLHDIERAKEYGRKAVVASEGVNEEEFSKNIVEFMKVCERISV